ncbi:MAG: hypothetical protein ACOC2W_01945, partial [bacterium]
TIESADQKELTVIDDIRNELHRLKKSNDLYYNRGDRDVYYKKGANSIIKYLLDYIDDIDKHVI